jgi:hypothetical protein
MHGLTNPARRVKPKVGKLWVRLPQRTSRIESLGASVSLKISLTATNTTLISWPHPSTGWNLQQNSNMATTGWITPPETINNDGTNNFIIVSPQSGHLFFRLEQ